MTVVALGLVLAALGVPSWVALLAGAAIALLGFAPTVPWLKPWTTRVLQAGVVALGAGMNLERVIRVGASGAALTALTLSLALGAAWILGKILKVDADTTLLVGVGTAICGGSAIAAIASVIKPKPEQTSVALGVVFLLNALGLVLFPPIGHWLGLSEPEFGRWAALAIHDTSSVVGAAMSFGPDALEIATTTKLARALWIVPLALGVALVRARRSEVGLKGIRWPWFIGGFLAAAALFSFVPALEPIRPLVTELGKRLLVLALFLVGLGLTRAALRTIGARALAVAIALWVILGVASLFMLRVDEPFFAGAAPTGQGVQHVSSGEVQYVR
ncbi:MAG: putative sulfate exporter family transporter [Myxococcota bacterium]